MIKLGELKAGDIVKVVDEGLERDAGGQICTPNNADAGEFLTGENQYFG